MKQKSLTMVPKEKEQMCLFVFCGGWDKNLQHKTFWRQWSSGVSHMEAIAM